MITVGVDFGTHQTKICYEIVEAGTTFYDVFRFEKPDGNEALTLPSFVLIRPDGTFRYGYDAMLDCSGGYKITYFKQMMFSLTASEKDRMSAEVFSILFLAYVIFKLDGRFGQNSYVVQMGMPTDANPKHYDFCKRQAIKVMASAMFLVRNGFHGDLEKFLSVPCKTLVEYAQKASGYISANFDKARNGYPILVFPEAYVALIPLIQDQKLPNIGPNLFVDIGGGTVDISFFTNQMDVEAGENRPCLYYYTSIPYGLNMITEQDVKRSHNVRVAEHEITRRRVDLYRRQITTAVDAMMMVLKEQYINLGKSNLMPFINLCMQVLYDRPVCYSGGGSMFRSLKLPVQSDGKGFSYKFSQVTTVSELLDHSKLYVDNAMFHVLATAFALSHRALSSGARSSEPDSIWLVSIDNLFGGIRIPNGASQQAFDRWGRPKRWNW